MNPLPNRAPPGILTSVPRRRSSLAPSKERFPWLLCLLVVASAYLFWGLPRQQSPKPIKVEFR